MQVQVRDKVDLLPRRRRDQMVKIWVRSVGSGGHNKTAGKMDSQRNAYSATALVITRSVAGTSS